MSPKEKLGHNAVRDVSVGVIQYPNQRLLNSNKMFASKPNYIFFYRSAYKQHHLHWSINCANYKIIAGKLTPETNKQNFRNKIDRFCS